MRFLDWNDEDESTAWLQHATDMGQHGVEPHDVLEHAVRERDGRKSPAEHAILHLDARRLVQRARSVRRPLRQVRFVLYDRAALQAFREVWAEKQKKGLE